MTGGSGENRALERQNARSRASSDWPPLDRVRTVEIRWPKYLQPVSFNTAVRLKSGGHREIEPLARVGSSSTVRSKSDVNRVVWVVGARGLKGYRGIEIRRLPSFERLRFSKRKGRAVGSEINGRDLIGSRGGPNSPSDPARTLRIQRSGTNAMFASPNVPGIWPVQEDPTVESEWRIRGCE